MRKCWIPFYWLIQLSWGFLQTLAGFALFCRFLSCPHRVYRGAVLTHWPSTGGISLGPFIFAPEPNHPKLSGPRRGICMAAHEYGHTFQSLLLGPLYLLIIGLPSFIWANARRFRRMREQKHISYSRLYTERWADYLGEKQTGIAPWREI